MAKNQRLKRFALITYVGMLLIAHPLIVQATIPPPLRFERASPGSLKGVTTDLAPENRAG